MNPPIPPSTRQQQAVRLLTLLLGMLLGSAPGRGILALGEEDFGNTPVGPNRQWPEGLLSLANDTHRVYRSWVNGNESFFFTGDTEALESFLQGFARVKLDVREVVLLPVPGLTKSFEDKPVSFSWRLHAPSGLYLAAALAEKDSNVHVPKPTVFVHVAGDIQLARLEIPSELSVLGPEDMVLRGRRALKGKQQEVRAEAASLLCEHAYVEGVVDAVAGLLDDPEEHAALSAAQALARCGKRAAKAIDALKRRGEKGGARVAKQCRDAIAAIEAAPPLDEAEERLIRGRLQAIGALKEARRMTR